jgi:hypothetical protein
MNKNMGRIRQNAVITISNFCFAFSGSLLVTLIYSSLVNLNQICHYRIRGHVSGIHRH